MAQNAPHEHKGFFDSLVDDAKNAGSALVNGVGKVGSMAVDGVKSAGSAVGDVAGKAVDAGKVFVSDRVAIHLSIAIFAHSCHAERRQFCRR
jgi:hypothetical protein